MKKAVKYEIKVSGFHFRYWQTKTSVYEYIVNTLDYLCLVSDVRSKGEILEYNVTSLTLVICKLKMI